jgi:putative phage-type endonuclease
MTASKVAAALGVSPWESPRSLWHQMHGDVPWPGTSEVKQRGHYLEPAILAWWRDQHPEFLSVLDLQPTYVLGEWGAATPDAVAVNPDDSQRVLVEAKSAAYDDEWGDPGTDQIPPYYLAQCYWQMHVSDVHRCYVPIITSRLRFAEYVVDYDPEIGADLEQRMRAFYDSLASATPPPLDDSVATFEAMRKVHPDIDADAVAEVTEAEAVELLTACDHLATAEARDRLARAVVLDRMGRARFAVCNGIKVARRQPNKSGVSFVPLPKNLPLLTTEDSAA